MIMCSVLISYCICRRPSWKPKTQPNGSSAVVWLSFWFSIRFTRKTFDYSNGSCPLSTNLQLIHHFWKIGKFVVWIFSHLYTVSPVRWDTYFLVNRVENQKLNQTTAELPFGWVFGVKLGLRQTHALIKTKTIPRKVPPAILLFSSNLLLNSNVAGETFLLLIFLVLICAWVCRRPSLTPKTQPPNGTASFGWVFGVQLSLQEKKFSI